MNKKEIKKGDVFSIKMSLQGIGNLHNIDFPKIQLPKGLTLYGDPKEVEKFTFTSNGAEGKIDLEYTIQVNKEGSFTIPPIEVSYFDVKTKKYVTIKSDQIKLDGNEVQLSSTNSKGKTTIITEKQNNQIGSNENENDSFFSSPFVWVSLSSLVLIAGFFALASRTKKKSPTIAFDKSISIDTISIKHTWNDVENHLVEAENAIKLNDSNQLILSCENALLTGIRVVLNEHSSSISTADLLQRFRNNIENEEFSDDLKLMLEKCQNARFGWGLSDEELQVLLPSIKKALENLKSNTI
jgi:hypothetical protein